MSAMDETRLAASAHQVLREAIDPRLPGLYRGKVRDNYDLPDGRRILVTSDRLSAFDRVLCCIPFKGQVLNGVARWAFEQTADLCPNHVLDYPDPNIVVGRRLEILPVEIVVRGYLAGSTSTSILTCTGPVAGRCTGSGCPTASPTTRRSRRRSSPPPARPPTALMTSR